MITNTMRKALAPEEKGLQKLVGTIGLEPTTPTMSRCRVMLAKPMNTPAPAVLCQPTMTDLESSRLRARLQDKRELLWDEYASGLDSVE